MNLVEHVMGMFSGDVINKLSRLIGKDPATTKSAVTTAVPALLSGMSQVASTPEGAQKMASALGNTGLMERPDGMLNVAGEKVAEQGSSMMSSLFGGGASGLNSAVSRVAGLDGATTSKLMAFLTPMVLGGIAKHFSGQGGFSVASLTNLFSSQKANIFSALPSEFSVSEIPGLSGASSAAPETARSAADAGASAYRGTERAAAAAGRAAETMGRGTANAASSARKWLAPVLLGVCLLAALIYFMRRNNTVGAPPPTAGMRVDATQVSNDVSGTVQSLTESISGIKDAASAESAIPKLQELDSKLDRLKGRMDKLPDAASGEIAQRAGSNLNGLVESMNNALKIPGVPEKVRPVLSSIVGKLSTIARVPSSQYTLVGAPAIRTASEQEK
jgi:hypothetical protein